MVEATHTIGWASNDSSLTATDARGDQDWYKFSVDPLDTMYGEPYVIEAKAMTAGVDPVVEVYGPVDSSHSIAPSDPRAIFTAGGETDRDIGNATCVAANDDGPWFGLGSSSSVTLVPVASRHALTYYFRVRPHFGVIRSGETTVSRGYGDSAGPYKVRVKIGTVTRLAGTNRVKTSVAVSQERYADGELSSVSPNGIGTVIVASAADYPDALAASSLAGAVNGPILLTEPNTLSREVKAEIKRLGAKQVFLLGSEKAITAVVENQLRTVVADTQRLAGDDRVETAILIAAQTGLQSRSSKVAFIVNGWSFADAACAAPMAAHNLAPILLTHGTRLDSSVVGAITGIPITDVVIVGSKSAVSGAVQNQLATLLGGSGHVKRISGADRYETSRNFAVFATGSGTSDFAGTLASPSILKTLDYKGMAVCSGTSFSDALSGGVFAGGAKAGFPLLLTPSPGSSNNYWYYPPDGYFPSPWILEYWPPLPAGKKAYLASLPGGPVAVTRSYVIGGPSAVSESTLAILDEISGADSMTFYGSLQTGLSSQARLASIRGHFAGK